MEIETYKEKKKMLSAYMRIPRKKKSPAGTLTPVMGLIPEPIPSSTEEKPNYISLELKSKAGSTAASSQTYKKYVRKFEEGTPEQWIELIKDVEEIWTQNSIRRGPDRCATVRSLLRGESLAAFNTAIEEQTTPGKDESTEENMEITTEMVDTALQVVAKYFLNAVVSLSLACS